MMLFASSMTWLRSKRIVGCVALAGAVTSLVLPQSLQADENDGVVFELRPYCDILENEGGFAGPLPDTEYFLNATWDICPQYGIHDPLSRETGLLSDGDTEDMVLVIRNPKHEKISRVRAWIAYDPSVLEGQEMELLDTFDIPVPGENDFSPSDGYIKIAASTNGSEDAEIIPVARFKVKVLGHSSPSTVLSFYDETSGSASHTATIVGSGSNEQNVVSSPLGSLVVRLRSPLNGSGGGSATSQMAQLPASSNGFVPNTTSAPSVTASSAPGVASSAPGISSGGSQSSVTNALAPLSNLFTSLQVLNLRVTTEGSSAFLAWDALPSSELKGYNVYYGTVSGQYIQRKGVDKNSNTLTIRALPTGVTYYFAVRAFNANNQETVFSQEVAVTIGDPKTSTSPLTGNVTGGPAGKPPKTDGTVSGETGMSSTLVLLLVASAVIGTALAFRRQFMAKSPA